MSARHLALYSIVRRNPGIHFRNLARAANIHSMGQLRHHVDRLCGDGLLVERSDGGYSRFLVQGEHKAVLRPLIVRLARPMPSRIARMLLERPLTRTALRRGLDCADSTVGYHLNRMVAGGDVTKRRDGNRCYYGLVDEASVREALDIIDGVARPDGDAVDDLAAVAAAPTSPSHEAVTTRQLRFEVAWPHPDEMRLDVKPPHPAADASTAVAASSARAESALGSAGSHHGF